MSCCCYFSQDEMHRNLCQIIAKTQADRQIDEDSTNWTAEINEHQWPVAAATTSAGRQTDRRMFDNKYKEIYELN